MDSGTLSCPMCGAPAAIDAARCEHCGATLATVQCPSCFGMMFVGAKFCSHCGAQADRKEIEGAANAKCPRCHVEMAAVEIGTTKLRECKHCEGIWADAATLQQICDDREKMAAVAGMASSLSGPSPGAVENVSYIPCPVCKQLMNRVNFAHCSNVVVDVCKTHGTWFDTKELQRVVEFIRAGGMEKDRVRQIEELEARKRQANVAGVDLAFDANPFMQPKQMDYSILESGIAVVGSLLAKFFLK